MSQLLIKRYFLLFKNVMIAKFFFENYTLVIVIIKKIIQKMRNDNFYLNVTEKNSITKSQNSIMTFECH